MKPDKFISYECMDGEKELHETIEEARKHLTDYIRDGDEDDCIPDDHGGISGIFEMVETIRLPVVEKKEDYPCLKHPKENCDGGANDYEWCTDCENQGYGWPHSPDHDYIVDIKLEKVDDSQYEKAMACLSNSLKKEIKLEARIGDLEKDLDMAHGKLADLMKVPASEIVSYFKAQVKR